MRKKTSRMVGTFSFVMLLLFACATVEQSSTLGLDGTKTKKRDLLQLNVDPATTLLTATEAFEFNKGINRYKEDAFSNLMNDSLVWCAEEVLGYPVDFAITNGGIVKSGLPQGNITQEHFEKALPFNNFMYMIVLNGSDVVDLFNGIAKQKQGSSGFAQVSKEVRYTITYNRYGKKGKISDITIAGEPINLEKKYLIATIDYLTAGGDGYDIFKKANNRKNTDIPIRNAVIAYAQKIPSPIIPATLIDGRIKILGGVKR